MYNNKKDSLMKQKKNILKKYEKYFELYKAQGYALDFNFRQKYSQYSAKQYLIVEIVPKDFTKDEAIKSGNVITGVFKVAKIRNDRNTEIKIINSIKITRFLEFNLNHLKNARDNNIKLNIKDKLRRIFNILVYPDFLKKYYKTDYIETIIFIGFIFLVVLFVVVGIVLWGWKFASTYYI